MCISNKLPDDADTYRCVDYPVGTTALVKLHSVSNTLILLIWSTFPESLPFYFQPTSSCKLPMTVFLSFFFFFIFARPLGIPTCWGHATEPRAPSPSPEPVPQPRGRLSAARPVTVFHASKLLQHLKFIPSPLIHHCLVEMHSFQLRLYSLRDQRSGQHLIHLTVGHLKAGALSWFPLYPLSYQSLVFSWYLLNIS